MNPIISGIQRILKVKDVFKTGSSLGRIDTHHHIVPKFYDDLCKKITSSSFDYPNPEWSLDKALKAMDLMNINTAILSLSAPGVDFFSQKEGRDCARQVNEYSAEIVNKNPERFGFFATVPCLTDVEGALAEIKYAYDHLKPDGVILMTTYKDRYLGEEDFKPIWEELNRRKAVVFIHPTYLTTIAPTSKFMPQPEVDFPYQTTKTATHLVVTNRVKENPDVKIILSHAGGFLPYSADRFAVISFALGCGKTMRGIHKDFKKFYYDTALSSGTPALKALLEYADPDRILFGSDFPHAKLAGSEYFTQQLDRFPFESGQLKKIHHQNALSLFPRLTKVYNN